VPARRIGFEAARLLDACLKDANTAPPAATRLRPDHVVARKSTDRMAVADPEIAKALHFIRTHAHQPIQVSDILDDVPLSRRGFERRFFKCLGRSPLDEIHRIRIEHARKLLRETSLPMSMVAEGAGFGDGKQFSTLFKLKTGQTPSTYRREHAIPECRSLGLETPGWGN
jgi:LacI family transcriptional regulator